MSETIAEPLAILTNYTQAEENALAISLVGKSAGYRFVIINN